MMSAALPWIGALSAARSAASRTLRLLLSSSGRYRRLPEHRRGVAVLAGLVDDVAQVVAHPAEPGEVLLHLHLGLFGGDLQLRGKAVRAQPVGQPVRHRLDPAPQFGGDLVDRNAERPRRDERVQVLTGAERLDEALVLATGGP